MVLNVDDACARLAILFFLIDVKIISCKFLLSLFLISVWQVQFLDRHHLLIKFGSVDGGVRFLVFLCFCFSS